MEEFPKPKKEERITEHAGVTGPELELPLHTPEETEIQKETPPEVIRQSVDNLPEQWKKDDGRKDKGLDTPTIH